MISYLERHNVPWQIIVTKSDKVPAKQLAKRITIMKVGKAQKQWATATLASTARVGRIIDYRWLSMIIDGKLF